MLDDLIAITHSESFEESEGFYQLVEAWLEGDALYLSLDLHLAGGDVDQTWKIECVSPLEHQIALGLSYQFELDFDHILLWTYTKPLASLSFYGEATDPSAVVGALYRRHSEIVGDWIPFGRFLNGNPYEMIRGRYGRLIESAPLPLAQAYSEVLNGFGISNELSNITPPTHRNDPAEGEGDVAALVMGRYSYVVAVKFNEQLL